MSGGIDWTDQISFRLREIAAKSDHMQDDVAFGAKEILRDAVERVPKESTHLASTGNINRDRGGKNTVAITFSGPYARWIHEHIGFKHPRGGEAKFLEIAMLHEGRNAIKAAGDKFWRRIK